MGQVKLTWAQTPTDAYVGLVTDYQAKIEMAVYQILSLYAPQIEVWLKANAPWTDRTGHARAALFADVEYVGQNLVIAFGHGVSYGVFLETINAGKFSVLGPATDIWMPVVWQAVKRLLEG
jgi:hypothetical protein